MLDLDKISEELFNKIRGRFSEVTIGDQEGNVTNVPKDARYFDFKYDEDSNVSVSISEKDGVVIMYNNELFTKEQSIQKSNWYSFLKELRSFARKRLLNFDVRDITKSNLNKRDYKYLATNSGDDNMTESKLYGTGKVSYQNVDSARIVIKHTESVNQERAGGRTQKIGTIHIESVEGERFKYPFKHLNGARAMARHVAEGGNAYDDFGKHIVGMSEELNKLKKFKNHMSRNGVMAEGLAQYSDVVNDRIDAVKRTVETLQRKNVYAEAVANFESTILEDVPEDVSSNWVDQLTIRQFNEELSDIFPYIYKLVSEHTKALALGPEELLGEASDDEIEEARSSASDQAAKAGAYNGGKSLAGKQHGKADLAHKLKGDALQKHRDASVAKMDAEDEAAKKAQRDRLNTEGDEALTLSFLSASLKNKMKPVKRNPVASHAQSSGSGTHQDQHNKNKPDRKQKHKKPIQADESIKSQLWAALNSK